MAQLQNKLTLFGLDLRQLGNDWLTACQEMARWKVFAWLTPQVAVRLYLPDGSQALVHGLKQPASSAPSQKVKATPFQAVLLPEDMLLRRAVSLPQLGPQDRVAALALESQSISPFAPDDTLWQSVQGPGVAGVSRWQIVLTSRKQVQNFLAQPGQPWQGNAPEVWVLGQAAPASNADHYLALPGFGENRRLQNTAWRQRAALALVATALALAAGMAVTPTAQLRLRALQAVQSFTALQQKAAPSLQHREALVLSTERLQALQGIVGQAVPPLVALDTITRALPDDTSLLSLRIEGNKVSLQGQTSNSASLMQSLSMQPGLRDVKAPSPAVKPPGAPKESFSIEFVLAP